MGEDPGRPHGAAGRVQDRTARGGVAVLYSRGVWVPEIGANKQEGRTSPLVGLSVVPGASAPDVPVDPPTCSHLLV